MHLIVLFVSRTFRNSSLTLALMNESEKIRVAFERSHKALSLKPSLGLGTGISKTRIENGLTCRVSEGPWELNADMPEAAGGNSAGPTPGVYGRAALGSCLAIGYMMRASKNKINIHSLEVEVQASYDDGPLFGTRNDVPPGYTQVKYIVTIESDAPEEEIMKILDEGDEHSPYLDVFTRSQSCVREVKIITPKEV
jgi:uncharacterized OsmC-like protein